MQPIIVRIVSLLTLMSFFLTSCKKDDDIRKPIPPTPAKSNKYQLVIPTLPGESSSGIAGLYAQVTVINEKNENVLENVKLSLQFDGQYKTDLLELPAGQYRIIKLQVKNASHITRFVAPVTGSAKASQVTKPLYISYSLPQNAAATVPVEVLRVESGDTPESFGYPAGSFNLDDGNTQPDPVNPNFKIKVRARIQIGDIVYDSLPVGLRLTVVENNANTSVRFISLDAKTNEIELPKTAVSYRLSIEKWGVTDELFLTKDQVNESTVYVLGGSKTARKLKSEVSYKLVNGNYVADNKVEYNYDASGVLNRINYYEKQADGRPFLARYELLDPRSGKVENVRKYDGKDVALGTTSFHYDAQGKISSMQQREGANVQARVTFDNLSGTDNVTITYTYAHHPHTHYLTMDMTKGNMMQSIFSTPLAGTEIGRYDYDQGINPRAHIGLPDFTLSNLSKNNLVYQQITFNGSVSRAYPYQFNYKYNSEGYPM